MAYMLKESTIIRDAFKNKIDKLVLILNNANQMMQKSETENNTNQYAEIQFSCISLVHLLIKHKNYYEKGFEKPYLNYS